MLQLFDHYGCYVLTNYRFAA